MGSMAFGSAINPMSGKRERKTISSSVVGLTPANYTLDVADVGGNGLRPKRLAQGAMLQVVTDSIYWTIDGSTPSASVGYENAPGDIIYLDTPQKVKEFKAIRKTTDAAVEAVYLFGN